MNERKRTMTNESIFYIIGLVLGFVLGYQTKSLMARNQVIKIVIKPNKSKEGADDERN